MMERGLLGEHLRQHSQPNADRSTDGRPDQDLNRRANTFDPRFHRSFSSPLDRAPVNSLASAEGENLLISSKVMFFLDSLRINDGNAQHQGIDAQEDHGGGHVIPPPAPAPLKCRPYCKQKEHDGKYPHEACDSIVFFNCLVHCLFHGVHVSLNQRIHGHPENAGQEEQALNSGNVSSTIDVENNHLTHGCIGDA